MTEVARLISVEETLPSSTVLIAAFAGEEVLALEDVAAFAEEGGTLQVNGTAGLQTYAYGPPDDEANTLPLLTPLTDDVEEGDEVRVPHALTRWASVVLDDAPDVPVLARVPHSLVGRLPSGVYADSDLDALTIAESAPGSWVVVDVLGREFARPGYADTDWTNSKGIKLIVGDGETDTAELLFGTHEMVAENRGPEDTTFPPASGGTWRRIGREGVGTGSVAVTTDFPAKVTLSGVASVINSSGTDWNVRFFLAAINADTGDEYLGRQGTTICQGGDGTAPQKHRQVTNERQFFFDATPESPTRINFWWGFQQDTGASRSASVRNMKMTLRVSYAPDVPTDDDPVTGTPGTETGTADPDRAPKWTSFADTAESYVRVESNDLDP